MLHRTLSLGIGVLMMAMSVAACSRNLTYEVTQEATQAAKCAEECQTKVAVIKGEKGERGERGERGKQGGVGKPGKDGRDGSSGKDGRDGKDGKDGRDDKQGNPSKSSPSSVESLGRLLVAPVLIWILSTISMYGLRRLHLARVIYHDIDFRLRFAILCCRSLHKWLLSTAMSDKEDEMPFLSTGREEHLVYASLQEDLRHCLWFSEVVAVRVFYRDFEEIEYRAGKIEALYEGLVEHLIPIPNEKSDFVAARKVNASQIDEHLKIIRETVNFWLGILAPNVSPTVLVENDELRENPDFTFKKAASALLFSAKWWYPLFCLFPLLLMIGSIVFLLHPGLEIWSWLYLGFLLVVVFASLVSLPFLVRENRNISKNVLSKIDKRLAKKLGVAP